MNFWQRWFPLTSLLLHKRRSAQQNLHEAPNNEKYLSWKENLIVAILEDDKERVSHLIRKRPIEQPDDRLYGVITGSEEETGLIVVRNDGTRLTGEDVIAGAVDVL